MRGGIIDGASATNGGAIYVANGATLILDGVTIQNCTATKRGGAIYVENGGSLIVYNATIFNCTAGDAGGAIALQDTCSVMVYNCTITDCFGQNCGGALHATMSSSINIYNIQITGCSTDQYGGAIYTDRNCEVSIKGGEFTGNNAGVGGGAICVSSGSGWNWDNLVLSGGLFKDNSAAHGGGAIFLFSATCILQSDVTICNNTATNGGGIGAEGSYITLYEGKIYDNTAENMGGGVYLNGGTFIMLSGTIGSGTATSAATSTNYSNHAQNGGGFAGEGNLVVNISGGNIGYNYATGHGGGVYTKEESVPTTINIINVARITYNCAANYGGGIRSGSVLNMSGGVVLGNSALYGGGVILSATRPEENSISGGQIINNTARHSAGVHVDANTVISGNVTFKGNTASNSGGAIGVAWANYLSILAGSFSENAAQYGSIVYVHDLANTLKITIDSGRVGFGSSEVYNARNGSYKVTINSVSINPNLKDKTMDILIAENSNKDKAEDKEIVITTNADNKTNVNPKNMCAVTMYKSQVSDNFSCKSKRFIWRPLQTKLQLCIIPANRKIDIILSDTKHKVIED